jgi:hypothetical protein
MESRCRSTRGDEGPRCPTPTTSYLPKVLWGHSTTGPSLPAESCDLENQPRSLAFPVTKLPRPIHVLCGLDPNRADSSMRKHRPGGGGWGGT